MSASPPKPRSISWKLSANLFDLTAQIPAKTTATAILPALDAGDISESGWPLDHADGVQFEQQVPGQVFLTAGSGRSHFQAQRPAIVPDPQESAE